MRNLVLGSEGFVGTYFCKYLLRHGEEVIRCDIKINEKQDLRFHKMDLSGIDRVYFLAWDVGGAKYLYRQDTQISQLLWNLQLMQNVFPQLMEAKIPFLFISSQLADEVDSVYGVTKRLGEKWTQLGHGKFVRLWNVYGPIEEFSEKTHVVSDFVLQAIRTKEIKMMTTGLEKRQFVHIEDVCDAFTTAMNTDYTGTVDVTSFEWVKIIDLANIISEQTNAVLKPGEVIGSTPLTPIYGKLPGWSPKVTLEAGIKMMIDQCK